MGNRITRTVLFAASALLSISAFGAGAARFGTLRNSDWVVTNAWQAVSNKTHDLILEIGQGDSLPPDWQNVSNAAMNAVQSLQPAYDYTDNTLISFSSTGSVFRSLSYGTPNRWTDATGCVWEAGYKYDDDWVADSSRISQVSWISSGYDEDPSLWAIYFTVDGSIQAQIYSLPPGSTQTNRSISASDWIDQYEGAFDFNIYRSPHESTNLVGRVALTNDIAEAISTNNEAFISAVLAAPLVGADPSDLSELSEYGTYGTVGAALLALIAGLAALKRRMASAETAIIGKASLTDLPYALVTPGEWELSGVPDGVSNYSLVWDDGWFFAYYYKGESYGDSVPGAEDALELSFILFGSTVTATRASLPGHLLDRAVNAVPVSSATEITLPEKLAGGKSRDFYVRLTVSAESAVMFAATDSGGDAVAWDSMGNPSGTLAAGTYLYRLTEVADSVFHAADITSGGSLDPAVLDEKLDASSAAPPFSESLTYLAGEYVTYGGVLYRCKTAVTVAGAWTGTSNWEADDMTSPDATLDIMSDGRLRVVTVAGEDLWMQGYDLESTSAQVLKCEKVNLLKFPATAAEAFDSTVAYAVGDSVVYGGMVYKFTAAHSAGDWVGTDAAVDSVSLTMPYVPVGKVGDFVLDVDNSANASVKMVAELSGLFTAFDVFVDKGRNLSDLLTFDGGEQCELHFTMTAFGTQAKPAWKVVKQVVERQEVGS